MIRDNNPEIDVVELMKRVRAEAAKIRISGSIEQRRSGWQDDDDRRTARALDRAHFISHLLTETEAKNLPRAQWPKRLAFLRFLGPISTFFLRVRNYLSKEQREKDTMILQAMRETIAMTAQVGDYALRIRESHRVYEQHRRELSDEFDRLRPDIVAMKAAAGRIDGLEQAHHVTHERSIEVQNGVAAASARIDELSARLDHAHERLSTAERDMQAIGARLEGTPTFVDLTARIAASEQGRQHALDAAMAAALRANALVRAEVADLRRSVGSEDGHVSNPRTIESLASIDVSGSRASEALYMAIEDRFRGARTSIEQRLREYLPIIESSKSVSDQTPLLDLGCGRGDFLKVLKEAGFTAIGIDSNEVAVAEAVLLGLDVERADLFERLRRTPSRSIGALSAIHVIEHIPFDLLVELLGESMRVLVPGGIAIFESPNPENVRVAASTFYLDPTHRLPVHPELALFVAESLGFTDARVMRLHPPDDRPNDEGDADPILTTMIYGPQDYALVARAPMA